MKNFLKGLSFSQLLAGALAAVTSFLLSSKIGIAGSVIGVAVASIVSTSASQIYQNVIDASSKKLQDAAAQQLGEQTDGGRDGASDDDASDDARMDESDGQASKDGKRKGRVASSDAAGAAGTPSSGRPQLTRHDKRVAIVVAVVSGLIAVAVTAGVILALTGGRGTDSVVHDIVSPSVTSEEGGELSPSPSQSVITPTPDATSTPDAGSTQPTQEPQQQDGTGAKDDSGSDSQTVEPSTSPSASQGTGAEDGTQGGGSTDSGQDGGTQQGDGRQKDDAGQQPQ